jgi:hypothetical protein
VLVGKVDQSVFGREDEAGGVHFLLGADDADAALEPPAEAILRIEEFVEIFAAWDQHFLEIEGQTSNFLSFSVLPILRNEMDLQILLFLDVLSKIFMFHWRGEEEIAQPKFFDKSGGDSRTEVEF